MVLVFALILLGFLLGVVAVVAAEALGLLWILKRLRSKTERDQAKISSKTQLGTTQLDPHQSLNFAFKKEVIFYFHNLSLFYILLLLLLLGTSF